MMRMAGVAESRIKRSQLRVRAQALSTVYMQSTPVALMLVVVVQ